MRPAALLTLMTLALPAAAADPAWPQFRGPGAAGVADGANVPVKFGLDTNLAWKVPVPAGLSAPVVAGDKLFLTGLDAGKLYTLAYDRHTGKELWRAAAPAPAIEKYHKTEGSPAASTVATDGTRVVSYFGSCGLHCYDTAGKELWAFATPVAETDNDFGTGTSPAIAGDVVLLLRDVKKGSKLYAVDLATGKERWHADRDSFKTSYSSPAVWNGQAVVAGALRLTGYDLATGKVVWTAGGMPAVPCTTPVVVGGDLVYAGWSPGQADMKLPNFGELLKADADKDGAINLAESKNTFMDGFFESNDLDHDGKITRAEFDVAFNFLLSGRNVGVRVRPGGIGELSKTQLAWTVTKGLPYVPSPLVYRGQMLTVNLRGLVSAHDAATGAEVYAEEALGLNGVYASPVAADGHIYLFALDGTAVVIKAGDFPEVVHRAKLGERVAATPAPVDGTLYVRGAKHLFAFRAAK